MTELMLFLVEHPADDRTEQVVVSERLAGHPLTIRAMTSEEYGDFQQRAVKIGKSRSVSFDSRRFNSLAAVACTVDPDFRNAELIKALGVATPEQALEKLLLPGEVAELAGQINRLSGFNQDLDELRDEAKNS